MILSPREYATIYAILASSPAKPTVAENRNMADLLDALEAVGEPQGQDEPRQYSVADDVDVDLTLAEKTTLKSALEGDLSRYQVWFIRPIPEVLTRLEGEK